MKTYRAIFLILILNLTHCFAQTWQQLPDFPGTERDDATSFKIGNYVYCGSGLKTGWIPTRDFYRFNLSNESWDSIASMPEAKERQYATAFSYNGLGYVFGGTGAITLSDMWTFAPGLNTWSQLSQKPGLAVSGASSFVLNGKAYIVGGNNSSIPALNEVWEYSIALDSWHQKNNFPLNGNWRANAAVYNNKAYLIFGRDTLGNLNRNLYEYDEINDVWTVLSVFPLTGRMYASMQVLGNNLVLAAGLDSLNNFYNDMWYFSFSDSTWHQQISLPAQGRKGGISFNAGNSFYYSTGIDAQNKRLKETWKIDNAIGITELKHELTFRIYPNPCHDSFEIVTESKKYTLQLRNNLGEILLQKEGCSTMIVSNLAFPSGLYYIKINTEQEQWNLKLIIH